MADFDVEADPADAGAWVVPDARYQSGSMTMTGMKRTSPNGRGWSLDSHFVARSRC